MIKEFSENLKNLREKNKLTQTEFAKILNITQRAYAHYEKGDREPSIETLMKIADYYDISIDILLGRYKKNNPYWRCRVYFW